MGDSPDLRSLARSHRDSGVPEVDYENYDASSRLHWGGPAPKWFPEAMAAYPERFANQRGKVALITGGTSGIGLYAAKLLAAVGFALILPQRPGLAHEAAGAMRAVTADVPGATVLVPTVPLDLASFASVRAFGTHLREEERALCNASLCAARRIDALLCNAGRGGGVHDEWELTGDGLEAIMQVNLLSHALLIAQLRPLLAASAHARVVLHSSSARHNAAPSQLGDLLGARRRLHPWGRYSLSKAAMCLAARALNAGRLQAAGIAGAACAADPGLAATGVNVQHDLAKCTPTLRLEPHAGRLRPLTCSGPVPAQRSV